ncbi:MAG TPA: flotillin family protein, partial [Vicinamibacteria bacterium]|nr:flotillin family protein [Vicinamibacteria bacterium]
MLLLAGLSGPLLAGARFIGEREVGLVVKRFSRKALPPGRLVAREGEAGYQAGTLSPGLHFGYWPWQYSVRTVPVTVIPQGEIGLVVAADGAPMAPERILGRTVDCDSFQDAERFLHQGGEKGRQMGILTAGTYRINTVLFTVITAQDAAAHGMLPEALRVYRVEPDRVGIVTTL